MNDAGDNFLPAPSVLGLKGAPSWCCLYFSLIQMFPTVYLFWNVKLIFLPTLIRTSYCSLTWLVSWASEGLLLLFSISHLLENCFHAGLSIYIYIYFYKFVLGQILEFWSNWYAFFWHVILLDVWANKITDVTSHLLQSTTAPFIFNHSPFALQMLGFELTAVLAWL